MDADTTLTFFNVYNWLRANQKRVLAGLIVLVVLAAGMTLWAWNKGQNEAAANQALLDIPTVSGLSASTGLPASDDAATLDALRKIIAEYPGTTAGASAQLLAARSLFSEGKYPEAQQAFAKFIADHPGHELIPQAQIGVAASLEGQGKISEAVTKYKEVAAIYSTVGNIVYPVKLTLGRLSEADNRPDQALGYYEDLARIKAPYRDPFIAEAQERYMLLIAKHPELNKAAAANPYQPPGVMNPSAADMQISPPAGASAGATNAPATPQP